jgi:uncharacterized protein (DUF697 family)
MTDREMSALNLVNRYSLYSAGVGLIPVPVVDMAGVAAIQVKMLIELSKHYEVPFSENRIKSIVAALLGGIAPASMAAGGLGQLFRSLPIVGQAFGFLTVSLFATAATWAVGRVFIQHFESGGTFLNFDPAKAGRMVQDEFEKAKSAGARKSATATA